MHRWASRGGLQGVFQEALLIQVKGYGTHFKPRQHKSKAPYSSFPSEHNSPSFLQVPGSVTDFVDVSVVVEIVT